LNQDQLFTLSAYSNQFSGTLPLSIFTLSNLTNLNLDQNHIGGTISSHIGQLTSVVDMTLNNNAFTGTIPFTIAQMTLLEGIMINNNRLSGVLPRLPFAKYDNFCDFSKNNFTCPLPARAAKKCQATCA
jgi:Leucine-rich repeat (LRR) protein